MLSKIQKNKSPRKEKGLAYVAILLLVAIMSTLGLTFLAKSRILSSATSNHADGMSAEYLAEAAANHALWRLLNESDFPADETTYYMHTFQGGRYGYKVRRHTDTTFATVATVGAFGENVDNQSYVLYVKPDESCPRNLLFVVGDALNLTSQESARKVLIEGWDWNVTAISDDASQAEFDSAATGVVVAYVPESIDDTMLGTKLCETTIGVVNEEGQLIDDFGMASGSPTAITVTNGSITDNTHYITSPFAVGDLVLSDPWQPFTYVNAGVATGVQVIATVFNKSSLMVADTRAELLGATPAAGRRVQLPWGSSGFDFNAINVDGQTIMERAIEWAAGMNNGCQCRGLVGYWELDETSGTLASDSSGNGNDGTLMDMDPSTDWVSGQLDGGLDFDGINDVVDLGSALELEDIFDGGGTAAAWIYPIGWGEGVAGRIFSKQDAISGNHSGWEFSTWGTANSLIFQRGFSSTIGSWEASTNSLSLNIWQHVAIVYDGSSDANEPTFYINGVPQTTIEIFDPPSGSPLSDAGMNLSLGNVIVDTGRTFDGIIDDARIYNRMLDPDEISALHALTEGGCSIPPVVNQAPVVDAGSDQTICPPFLEAQLDGEVTDDGLPDPPATVTTTWSKVSGPGTVTFDDSLQVDTLATFSEAGEYVLRLRANDSELEDFSEVTITIEPIEENLVNTYTPSAQTTPSVAVAPDGSFVIAWESWQQDGESLGIYAQRYDADGLAVGGEIPVNTSTTDGQENPDVAIDDSGNFVIAWETKHVDLSYYNVFAQRFNASGIKQGIEFRVDAFSGANMINPSVAMAPTGEFVIAFEARGGWDGDGAGIYARRYDNSGASQGPGFRVNSTGLGEQKKPSVAMDGAGNFVVTWTSMAQDGSGEGVYAQRYNTLGVVQGAEFPVNTTTDLDQDFPDIAMSSAGNFVVVWQGDLGASTEVYFQRFDAGGAKQGSETIVNSTTALLPTVDMNGNGNFVVSWSASDGSGDGVYARGYSAGGSALASEFLVNTTTSNGQITPDVGIDDNDGFIVAWSGYSPADVNDGVFMGPFCLGVSGGGAGSLLFVSGGSGEPIVPTAEEQFRIDLMESWGFDVTLILANASQADFDAALANVDVVYVSADISSADLGTKLTAATVGVLSEDMGLIDEFGIAEPVFVTKSSQSINIIDNTHYITSGFGLGALAIASFAQSVWTVNGALAAGLQILGETQESGSGFPPGLAVLETGAQLYGGGSAAGRRVQAPWKGGSYDINALNADGRTVFKRALEWGAASGGGGGGSDTDPPTPDPMTWASPPAPAGPTSITMTATTATDPSGVKYYFECTAGGGNDSGWIDDPTYVDTGLSPNTSYTYRVKVCDKASPPNETGWSTEESATTPSVPEMFVNDIAMGFRTGPGSKYYGQATVWIKDDGGADVEGALVTGDWSGAVSEGAMGTTGSDGRIFFESPSKKDGGTFTFTVTDVSKSGYVYNPALNVMTSNSITVP